MTRKTLLPHQVEAVSFIKEKKKCILADDMGLGKTLSALTAVDELGVFPAVIMCPPSVKKQWLDEVLTFTTDVGLFSSTNPCFWHRYVIVPYTMLDPFMEYWNYLSYKMHKEKGIEWVSEFPFFKRESVARAALSLNKMPPRFLSFILDEAHITRRNTSNQAHSIKELLEFFEPEVAVFLSGTPVVNKPTDVIDMLGYCDFFSKEDTEYLGEFQFLTHFGQDNKVYNKILSEELSSLLSGKYMMRREKNILSIPPKKIHLVTIPVDNKLYEEEKVKYLTGLSAFSAINGLFSLTGQMKLRGVVREIKEIMKHTDGKIIVFAYHKAIQKELSKKLKCRMYNTARSAITFKDSKSKIAVMSLRACGTGINLQFCSTVVFAELFWTPAELEQAENRVHRIGQKQVVNVYYMAADGGLDKHLVAILNDKERYINYTVRQTKVMLFKEIAESIGGRRTRMASGKRNPVKRESKPGIPVEPSARNIMKNLLGIFFK